MNRFMYWFLGLALSGVTACSGDRLYEEFQTIPSQSWDVQDTLGFELGELDIAGTHSFIAVRYNENYAYSNCYLRIISKDTSGTLLDNKLINIPLFDSKTGEPLGKGFGSTYTIYDTLPILLHPDTKSLSLLQYMRQEKLPGIEAIGIKITD